MPASARTAALDDRLRTLVYSTPRRRKTNRRDEIPAPRNARAMRPYIFGQDER